MMLLFVRRNVEVPDTVVVGATHGYMEQFSCPLEGTIIQGACQMSHECLREAYHYKRMM
jgi:hypothetical protein